MNERMIFNNTIYRFIFLYNSKKEMASLGMTFKDLKSAFFKIPEQKEYFETVANKATFVFSDLMGNSFVAEKEGNIIKIITKLEKPNICDRRSVDKSLTKSSFLARIKIILKLERSF